MHPDWRPDVPLGPLTTLGVGGPAQFLVECPSSESLRTHLRAAEAAALPVTVLGQGSNVLIADAGLPGLVVCPANRTLDFDASTTRVRAGAGASWDALVEGAVELGWSGVECLSGIPGTCGAAPIQNIGAYGQELSEVLLLVHALDRDTGQLLTFGPEECGLGYRTSHFKHAWRQRYLVTGLELQLSDAPPAAPRYGDLARTVPDGATAAQMRGAVLSIRAAKGMVLDPADPDSRSAGSFFTNPFVDVATADAIAERTPDTMPRFPAEDGRVKLSAAWLIERAGFARGERRGAARLSTKHVLALTNPGEATARELVEFAIEIRRRVEDRFGVGLVPEPRLLGFEPALRQALVEDDPT